MQPLKILEESRRQGYKLVFINECGEYYTHPPGGYRTDWKPGWISYRQKCSEPTRICQNAVHWSLHPASPFQYFAMAKPFFDIEPKDLGAVLSFHRVTVPKGGEIVRDAGAGFFKHIEHFKRGSNGLLFGDPLTGWWFENMKDARLGSNVVAFFVVDGRLHSVHPDKVTMMTLDNPREWLLPSLIVRREAVDNNVSFRYYWHSCGRIRYVIETKCITDLVTRFPSLFRIASFDGQCVPLIHSHIAPSWSEKKDDDIFATACALAIRPSIDYCVCWAFTRWVAKLCGRTDYQIDHLYPTSLTVTDERMLLTWIGEHRQKIIWPHGPVDPTFLRDLLLHPQMSSESFRSAMVVLLDAP